MAERTERRGRVEVDGVGLAYREVGDGEPVLLLHPGFIADAMVPLLSAEELSAYRLIAYHRRAYGDSDRAAGPVSVERHAADALALLDHLGARPAHLVGHSFGANVALQIAVQHPAAIGALVVMEPLLGFLLAPETAAYVGAAAEEAFPAFAAGEHDRALDAWLSGAFGPGFRATLDRALPGAWDTAVADAPAPFGGEVPALQGWAFGPADLAAVAAPTLSVVNSGTYWAGFRETHDQLLATIPGCEGVAVPVHGHLLQVADPAPVAAAIADFLRRHPLG